MGEKDGEGVAAEAAARVGDEKDFESFESAVGMEAVLEGQGEAGMERA